mmetsp:Transcript_111963/g.361469  ORF Transcript_111963/g.361469 Transcript_111963/m.361469 type:complete len:806 (-) Transcript_111963:301-2718(-)
MVLAAMKATWLALALGIPAEQAHGGSCNPFLGQTFYVNPENAKEYAESIATAEGRVKANLLRMQRVPSAYWIDVKAKVHGNSTRSLEGILKDASSKSPPELCVLIWYDLPNRDCDAKASNGEICCTYRSDGTCDYEMPGDCAEGIAKYVSEYADPFVAVLKEYQDKLPIVVVVEPDSLPNLATNSGHPKCGSTATQAAYKAGVSYAVRQLTTLTPRVSVYLDAAHGGWVGWENNLEKFMDILQGMDMPLTKVRGFATNVANYQPLGVQCPWCPDQGYRNGFCMNAKHSVHPCCQDPCKLLSQWNFGNNELNYAAGLVAAADAELGMTAHVIIDTGRNGVPDQRLTCEDWCNPRGAGAGVPSTAETANTSLVDAYFWLKTPGESDGCSQKLPDGSECPRFDAACASADSLGTAPSEPPAPEAGRWYDYQAKQLAANARFQPDALEHSDNTFTAACSTRMEGLDRPSPSEPTQWRSSSLPAESWSSRARAKEVALAGLATGSAEMGAMGLCIGGLAIEGLDTASFVSGGGAMVSENRLTLQHNSGVSITTSCAGAWDPNSFARFQLLGRTLSFTVDLSRVGCACNLALYLVQEPALDWSGIPSAGSCSWSPYYCDANMVCGQWCPEMDIMEANNRVFSSTPHKCNAPSDKGHYSACDRNGCGQNTRDMDSQAYGPGGSYRIDTTRPFDVHTTFHIGDTLASNVSSPVTSCTGMITRLQQDGKEVVLDHPQCSSYLDGVSDPMAAGMALRITYWGSDASTMSWLDQPPCGGDSCAGGNAGEATISNIRIGSGAASTPSPTRAEELVYV